MIHTNHNFPIIMVRNTISLNQLYYSNYVAHFDLFLSTLGPRGLAQLCLQSLHQHPLLTQLCRQLLVVPPQGVHILTLPLQTSLPLEQLITLGFQLQLLCSLGTVKRLRKLEISFFSGHVHFSESSKQYGIAVQ